MSNTTDEFSFILKPSAISGASVGIFAVHAIAAGTKLAITPTPEEEPMRLMREMDVPEALRIYCIAREGDLLACPAAFNHMWIGWYVNHSATPNAEEREEERYYAVRDISAGEEITIDYNQFNEPEEKKEDYYRQHP